MRRLSCLAALSFGLLALPALAEDQVYTWVDGSGVRHYAQTPPDGIAYEVRGINDPILGTKALPAPQPQGPQRPEDRRACERARLALDQLTSNVPLEMDQDGDGTLEPLDDTQRAEQRRLAEQSVRAFCNSGI